MRIRESAPPKSGSHTPVIAKRPAAEAPETPEAAPPNDMPNDAPSETPNDGPAAPAPAFRDPVTDKLEKASPAVRFGDMSAAECLRTVDKEGLAMKREEKAEPGVAVPMRISGSLHGVRFVVPPASSKFGVLDCRLGLALDELASSLAGFGVESVRIDNFYRPNAKLPGREKASQHAFGLAADITVLGLSGGRSLNPGDDWAASIGETPCGPNAVMPALEATSKPTLSDATTLRNIVCDVARKGLFHDVLTPSFNAAHRTHFHFDIKHATTHQALR